MGGRHEPAESLGQTAVHPEVTVMGACDAGSYVVRTMRLAGANSGSGQYTASDRHGAAWLRKSVDAPTTSCTE